MRKLSHWATRLALIAAATGGVVAACYDEVPGPSAPLPPTREVKPMAPGPRPLLAPMPARKKPSVVATHREFQPAATPAHDLHDAGVDAMTDLPPVRDASGLDAPLDKK